MQILHQLTQTNQLLSNLQKLMQILHQLTQTNQLLSNLQKLTQISIN